MYGCRTTVKDALSARLGASISYSYQVQARRQYVAKYSMSHWIDSMEKLKETTRPFSSKTLNEVSSSASSSDWMSIDFSGNDAEFEYTPEEQAEISKEVASTLQSNALQQLAHQSGVELPTVPRAELTQTGLQDWAKRKRKKCGLFFYCFIADYTGKLLADVWSNKEAIATFKRSNSGWQSRRVSGTKMVRRYGSAVFMPSEGPLEPSELPNY